MPVTVTRNGLSETVASPRVAAGIKNAESSEVSETTLPDVLTSAVQVIVDLSCIPQLNDTSHVNSAGSDVTRKRSIDVLVRIIPPPTIGDADVSKT